MANRAESLAKTFEAKVDEATAVLERLSEADWKTITSAEKWSVGVTAHHIAVSHELIAGIIQTIADGKSGPNLDMDAIHAMNATHARDHAGCTKSETLALHERNAAAAAATVRGLGDAQLDRSGLVIAGAPPMSAAQLAGGLLVGHVDEHLRSIRATVGA
jgi:hypothetical protein